jgi:deazaflavin-dependent oxidoreductase (nitroreductase family)
MAGQATIAPWLKAAFRLPDLLYRHGLGWVLGRRFLRLLHVGRRTGRRYATVLEVVRHDRRRAEYVVVSGFGTRTDWLRNIEAGNPVEVTVSRRTFVADHRRLDREEAFAVIADYERRNRVIGPVVRKALSWLLGWRYDGSITARWQLVEQLPMVALRPEEQWWE